MQTTKKLTVQATTNYTCFFFKVQQMTRYVQLPTCMHPSNTTSFGPNYMHVLKLQYV